MLELASTALLEILVSPSFKSRLLFLISLCFVQASKKVAKSNVFGVDFSIVAQEHPDGIPFIVKRCVAEIDNRALVTKVRQPRH